MFDAIAPRYDLVNRIMTFRLDVRWRRRTVRELALPAGSTVLDLASGTGDLCIDLRKAGHSSDLDRPLVRDARRRPLWRAPGAGRHPATARPRRVGRRRDVWVRAAQPHRSAARSSTSWHGSSAPGGRIALLDVGIPHNRFIRCGQRHLLRQDRAQDRRAAVRRRRLPVPAEERRLPPDAGRDGVDVAASQVSTRVLHQDLSGRPDPAAHRHARPTPMIAHTVAARVRRRPRTMSPVATVTCSCAKGSVSRVVASPHVCRSTKRSSSSPRSSTTTRSARRTGRSRSARCRSCRARRRRWSSRRWSSARTPPAGRG